MLIPHNPPEVFLRLQIPGSELAQYHLPVAPPCHTPGSHAHPGIRTDPPIEVTEEQAKELALNYLHQYQPPLPTENEEVIIHKAIGDNYLVYEFTVNYIVQDYICRSVTLTVSIEGHIIAASGCFTVNQEEQQAFEKQILPSPGSETVTKQIAQYLQDNYYGHIEKLEGPTRWTKKNADGTLRFIWAASVTCLDKQQPRDFYLQYDEISGKCTATEQHHGPKYEPQKRPSVTTAISPIWSADGKSIWWE